MGGHPRTGCMWGKIGGRDTQPTSRAAGQHVSETAEQSEAATPHPATCCVEDPGRDTEGLGTEIFFFPDRASTEANFSRGKVPRILQMGRAKDGLLAEGRKSGPFRCSATRGNRFVASRVLGQARTCFDSGPAQPLSMPREATEGAASRSWHCPLGPHLLSFPFCGNPRSPLVQ